MWTVSPLRALDGSSTGVGPNSLVWQDNVLAAGGGRAAAAQQLRECAAVHRGVCACLAKGWRWKCTRGRNDARGIGIVVVAALELAGAIAGRMNDNEVEMKMF